MISFGIYVQGCLPCKDIVKIGRNVTVARGVVASVHHIFQPGVDVAPLDIPATALKAGFIAACTASPIITSMATLKTIKEREQIYNKYLDDIHVNMEKDSSLFLKKTKFENRFQYHQSATGVLQLTTLCAAIPVELFSFFTAEPSFFIGAFTVHTMIATGGYFNAKNDIHRLRKIISEIEEE